MKITVTIRTYKRIDFLKECLSSISNQSYINWEVIVFDDSGDIDVHNVVNVFKDKHPEKRIVYITSFKPYDLFVKSIFYQNNLSEGDIIFKVDDDDFLPNYTFEKLVEMYSNNSDIDFSYGSSCFFSDIDKKVTGHFYNKSPLEYKTKNAWAPYTIPDNNPWHDPWCWIDDYYESETPFTSLIHASKANQMCLFSSYSFRTKSMLSVDLTKIEQPISTLCDDLEFLGSLEYIGLTYGIMKNILTFSRSHSTIRVTNTNQVANSGLDWCDEISRVRDKVDCLRPNNFITSNIIIGEEEQDDESLQKLLDETYKNIKEKINLIW